MGAERQLIRDALRVGIDECARDGAGQTFLLSGEAGIGKSTMCSFAIDTAREHGLQAWHVAAQQRQRSTPFSLLDRLVGSDGKALVDPSFDSGADVPEGTIAAERFMFADDAVAQFERHLQLPTLLVFDDLQWADPSSLEAIDLLSEAAQTHPVVVVLAYRSAEVDAELGKLTAQAAQRGSTDWTLGPMTDDEVTEMAEKLCGGQLDDGLRQRAHGAGGNPLLLEQFLDGLLTEGRLVGVGDTSQPVSASATAVPHILLRGVRDALQEAGREVARLVRTVSVAGVEMSVSDLAAMLDSSPMAISSTIDDAHRAGLLATDGDRLRFRHDMVREAVYLEMPTSLRLAAHEHLARHLAATGAQVTVVASHVILSAPTDGEQSEVLQKAAAEINLAAPGVALEFLDAALDVVGNDLGPRIQIERSRLFALTGAGRLHEAQRVAAWLVEMVDPAERFELRARLGGIATIMGHNELAQESLARAIEEAPSDFERAPILATAAIDAAARLDYAGADALNEQAIEIGERTGELIGHSSALALRARMSTYGNSLAEGLTDGARAVALADRDSTRVAHQYLPTLHYGQTACDADDLDTAIAMARRGQELAAEHHMAWSMPLYAVLESKCRFQLGELDVAWALAESSVELCQKLDAHRGLTWASSLLSLIALDTRDAATAKVHSDVALETWLSGKSPYGSDMLAQALARVMSANGEHEAAFALLLETWTEFANFGAKICRPTVALDLVRLALHVDDVEQARTVADVADEDALVGGVVAHRAAARWARALIDRDRAAGLLAIDEIRRTPRRLELADWLDREGDLVAPEGDELAPLREALEIFETAGATTRANELRQRLSESGESPTAMTGWTTLTGTELDIARLLADGLTNAEIARERGGSRRTVESHLRCIYRKLEIDGRVKLTVAAVDRFRNETPGQSAST